jgi:hypothetical protein
VPEINAGARLARLCAINPVIGLGTFLAQLFLRNPLSEAGTREFHVPGSWADPKVEPSNTRRSRSPPPTGARGTRPWRFGGRDADCRRSPCLARSPLTRPASTDTNEGPT